MYEVDYSVTLEAEGKRDTVDGSMLFESTEKGWMAVH